MNPILEDWLIKKASHDREEMGLDTGKSVNALVKELAAVKESLEQRIKEEIAKVAESRNLDYVLIGAYGNTYERNGREVSCKPIDDLEDVYLEHLHSGGFEALWKKGEGWC